MGISLTTKVHGVEPPEKKFLGDILRAVTCDAPATHDFTFTGNGSVVLVQIQPQSASTDLATEQVVCIGGSIPYQYYYNWSDIGIDVK
jgi:hypothetical protein